MLAGSTGIIELTANHVDLSPCLCRVTRCLQERYPSSTWKEVLSTRVAVTGTTSLKAPFMSTREMLNKLQRVGASATSMSSLIGSFGLKFEKGANVACRRSC